MPATRRNPVLAIFGNPRGAAVQSESAAWEAVKALAEDLAERSENELQVLERATELRVLANRMLAQLRRGVHANPHASPGTGTRTKIGDHVQAVLYVHTKDHEPYAHGFGNADISIDTIKDGDVKLEGLADRTDVTMYGEPDGTVTLEGAKGQRLWDVFQVKGR